MKKLLVALLAICIAFSAFSFVALAEETTGDVATQDGANAATDTTEKTETKTVESLVGAFYLQGESGTMAGGMFDANYYDYQIADKMAAALNGTNKVPFYAFDKDGSVFFDSFAEDYLISEANAAKSAGIDFFAYKMYMGYATVNSATNLMRNMNMQLIRHASLYGTKDFESQLNYALVLDVEFDSGKSTERNLIVDQFLIRKGYLVAEDGRPVVFIEWNEDIQNQISKLNSTLKKAVKDKTNLKEGVESIYAIALNAPSYDEAIAAGAEAVSWTEGAGKNGEAYTNMTATIEANWANGANVVPNVVTGFDKSLLADNPISVEAFKQDGKKNSLGVRYSRTGSKEDTVAAATPEELVNHMKNAVATTNKPANFNAVMVYAWDDFMGGASLCPTKTDKEFQYDSSYLNALRAYFYGKEDGITALSVLDNKNQIVITDSRAKTITTLGKGENGQQVEVKKVDFEGKDLLAAADTTPEPTTGTTGNGGSDGGFNMMYLVYGGIAIVVIAIVIIVIAVVSKKKKAPKDEK